jgi:RNA polymerase sigma factor (sigma-70 family)
MTGEAVLVSNVESVYRKERRRLLAFIRARVGGPEEAEDLLQDVFFQALRNADSMEPIENVLGWLYTIARNKIIDLYRRRKRTVSIHDEAEEGSLEALLASSGIDLHRELARSAVQEALLDALEELPAAQREAFLLQAVEGMTFREISEKSGTPINTLIARKRYAVQHLRRRLQGLRELLDELA